MALREYIPGADYGRYMGEEISEAKRVGGVPAAVGRTIGLAPGAVLAAGSDIAGAAEPIIRPWAQALKTAVTGDPTLIGQEPRQARVTPAVTTGTPKQPSTTTPSAIPSVSRGRATPARTTARAVESTRIWGPEQQGIQTGVDPRLSQQLSEARQAAAARGDWDAVNASYGPGGLRGDYKQPDNRFNPETDVIGSGDPTITELAAQAVRRRGARMEKEEAGRTERAALGEEGATRRAQMQEAGQESRFGRTSALEREKFTREQDDPRRAEQARLFGFQADTAQGQLDWQRKLDLAKQRIAIETDPKKKAGLIADYKFLSGGAAEKDPRELALKEVEAMVRTPEEYKSKYAFANGGEVRQSYFDPSAAWEKVKTGAMGALRMSAKEPAPTPAPTAIPTRASAEPDPSKGMWTLTEEEQAALPKYGYADGGQVGEDPRVAKYGQYLQAAAQSGIPPVPFAQYASMTQGVDQQMRSPLGYADGGDVSALERPLRGPGTGTSDSIPAVIDGVRPAALSTGEFVFDEATTKYYGTKFLKDLQRKAKEAEQGGNDGV